MFESLTPQPPDKIIALIDEFRADPRPDKLDLGVGVYRDAEGRTPVMRAVKAAEARLLQTQDSKSYKALAGDGAFLDAMRDLVLGAEAPADRIAAVQAPGGTGALHRLFELAAKADSGAVVWISDPSWPNHAAMLRHLGIPQRSYRYFDPATRGVDFAAMVEDLKGAGPRDVVLLHGCCHNPTGANLTAEQWDVLTEMALAQGFVPMIDLAYQGFGDGLAEDVAGLRAMAARLPEMLIAASCSKNFGVYRDRVGAGLVLCRDAAAAALAADNLAALNRVNYSFPPDHGAAAVTLVLTDPALRADWEAELDAMRRRMLALRQGLADALRRETNDGRFDFIASHRGMFSRLGASPEQVERLKREHGVYMVGDSRINVAGLREDGLEALARALVAVGL
ncbi:MAG: aminotransferase [Paracoccaceae bacterium]|nr:MAG: aspartate/tyrosine/aromatic aminotransferase [Alphaproteobacteria bacterium]GIX14457.1 MAG: aminotransferase [Paracoccaceae bacterium]